MLFVYTILKMAKIDQTLKPRILALILGMLFFVEEPFITAYENIVNPAKE